MSRIDWNYVQADADAILGDGLEALKAAGRVKAGKVRDEFPCNYLVSLNGEPRYAGEGQNAAARLRQQFREVSSTFYKSYLKKPGPHAALAEFEVQLIRTDLGRKELEEFGIVHIAAPLNKFPLGKREPREAVDRTGIWDICQAQRERLLDEGVASVMAAKPKSWFDCQPSTGPGLYAVIHQDRLIYVGESSDLSERHETHSDHTYFSALRRHIGTEILGYELQEVGGRKRSFTDDQDWKVTRFLTDCEAAFIPVAFGRYELEDRLIKTRSPLLNRKGALSPSGQKNAEPAGQAPQV